MTAAWEKTPAALADQRAGLRWWICLCGRHLSEHPFVNTDSNRWLRCALRDLEADGRLVRGRFESETLRVAFSPATGLVTRPGYVPEPALG